MPFDEKKCGTNAFGIPVGGTCLVPPDLYEFGPTKTCEIGPTGLLKNVLFSKTSEFGPTDFFLDPNLLPLSIYLAS